jgi:membrane protein DedA with SNARE-associated domain
MSLEEIVSTYGYIAIVIGTFLEGETVLVLGGFATHRGYLELPWVVICGFLGTLFGDQLYFFIGRIKGTNFLEKRLYWKLRSKRVFDLLHKHQLLLILGFRFLYGLRTVTPFLLGASGIQPVRFLIFNIIGAFFWAIAIGVSGYLFGHAFELIIGNINRYESRLFIALAAIGILVWFLHWFRQGKATRQFAKSNNDT